MARPGAVGASRAEQIPDDPEEQGLQLRIGEAPGGGRHGGDHAEATHQRHAGGGQDAGGPPPGADDPPFQAFQRGEGHGVAGGGEQQPIQRAAMRQAGEQAMGGIGGAVFGRQGAPGTGGTGDPEDGVHGAARALGGAAAGVRAGDEGGEGGPFGVGERAEGVGGGAVEGEGEGWGGHGGRASPGGGEAGECIGKHTFAQHISLRPNRRTASTKCCKVFVFSLRSIRRTVLCCSSE